MTSEIRLNTLKNRVGLGTISFTNTGAIVSGIVTANSFSGPTSGTTGTFSGNVDINGDLDVDGHTNLDNTDIVGILTVTSTTQYGGYKLSNNSNVVGELVGLSGTNDTGALALWSGGSKYVQLSASGNSFINGGNVSIGKDLDVDGHTNLDDVSVVGVTTITGASGTLLQVSHTAGSGGQGIIRTKATQANSSSFIRAEDSGSTYIGLLKYGTGHSAYGALGAGDGAIYANSGGGNDTNITIMADSSTGHINFATGGNTERLRITSSGAISFDEGTTAILTPSQATPSQIGDDTLSGGDSWFDHSGTTNYFGIDGDHKLTNGATYGKIVARNANDATGNTAAAAGHTWYTISKTVSGTVGQNDWRVHTVAGWKFAWPTNLAAGATTTFFMKDAVESYGSPTIPATGDYYISWFFSVSQGRGTNGGSYYVDSSSGGNVYWKNNDGDLSNPNQQVPRQGESWTGNATGDQMHVQYHTLPRSDLSGTIFTSPFLVDPIIQGVPKYEGIPMSGGGLVKEVQWDSNTASIELMNADFVNCSYFVEYSISGNPGWYETRFQFCNQNGDFYNNTNDYISHSEWLRSTESSPTVNNSSNERAGYARSLWLTGNGTGYKHTGYIWIIPSKFRHNRGNDIPQRWGNGSDNAYGLPHIFVRGHSYLQTGNETENYREEGGGTYRGNNNIHAISGFRLFGAASSAPHVPDSNGSDNGHVRIFRFKGGV